MSKVKRDPPVEDRRDQIVKKYRSILADAGINLTDEEIENIVLVFEVISEMIISSYVKKLRVNL